MALGYFLTEELLWSDKGAQLSLGSWQYKPPAVADIPLELNVQFLARTPNPSPNNVFGSKASAEPPMALGAAAFYAGPPARLISIGSPPLTTLSIPPTTLPRSPRRHQGCPLRRRRRRAVRCRGAASMAQHGTAWHSMA